MSKNAGNGVTWAAAASFLLLLIVLGLRRADMIGDGLALPLVALFVLGFLALTVIAGVRALRRRGAGGARD